MQNEPNWVKTHNHRIGYRYRDDRHPGYTHIGNYCNAEQQREYLAQANKEAKKLDKELEKFNLIHVVNSWIVS